MKTLRTPVRCISVFPEVKIFGWILIGLLSACGGGSGSRSDTPAPAVPVSSASSSSQSSSSAASSVAGLVPFVLPYDDDSAGITSLADLNHKPAGKFGSVGVNAAGHFAVNDERVRFVGVNITAGSAFPSHADAAKIARRLAKFGVNLVRFHHMDNNFGAESLINYAAGTSRTLNTANLDKLDYFIARLKEQGIYTNLNLLNSREFRAADGLPASIGGMPWKQSHVLGFVDDTFRQLEKEYAQLLLSHRNAYTGLTYAEDPAIAFVEVNNENGLLHQYFDGAVDEWPAEFRAHLDGHWNDWLQAKYQTTAAAETAWGAVDEPLSEEVLTNADFIDGISGWNLEQHSGAVASAQSSTFDGRAGMALRVTTAGAADWSVQLNQGRLALTAGQVYTLSFWAKSPDAVTLSLGLQQNYDPWGSLLTRRYELSSNWQYFETTFVASADDSNARINFNGFGNRVTQVHLANVSFKSGGSLGRLAADERVEEGTVKSHYRSRSYTPERERDWVAFLRELETDYWRDMNSYINDTLGYQGLTAGTAIMNSLPSAQKQFDFADAHAYWQHPEFPEAEWDAQNWTVGNESMVNALNNALSGLAKQRIKGIPFTVSEYQHASPNTYSSEGPLLAAAYGALQDWDGIMFFAYDAGPGGNWDARYFNDFFSMNAHPTKMANLLIAANLFRRGDVKVAHEAVVMNFDAQLELDILATRGSAWNVASGAHLGVPNDVPLMHRFALDVSSSPQGGDTPPAAVPGPIYTADTDELRWDMSTAGKGVVTINTARTKAVMGFMNGREFVLGNLGITVGETMQDWATLSLTLRDGNFEQPQAAASLLVVATGLVENTNMRWTDSSRTSLGTNWGTAPTRIEVIPAIIDLPFASASTRAWVLNETGQRKSEMTVEDNAGKARLVLPASAASLWYEVVVEESAEQ